MLANTRRVFRNTSSFKGVPCTVDRAGPYALSESPSVVSVTGKSALSFSSAVFVAIDVSPSRKIDRSSAMTDFS